MLLKFVIKSIKLTFRYFFCKKNQELNGWMDKQSKVPSRGLIPTDSVTRLGNLLDFRQVFKAFGSN